MEKRRVAERPLRILFKLERILPRRVVVLTLRPLEEPFAFPVAVQCVEESDRVAVLAQILQAQTLKAVGLERFLQNLANCPEIRASIEAFGRSLDARLRRDDLTPADGRLEQIRK